LKKENRKVRQKRRQNGGDSPPTQPPPSEPFSFSFSLILDEGGVREGWVNFAYSLLATAES
jgi:hypothetical protein